MQTHKAKKRLILHVKSVLCKLAKDLGIGPCDLKYVFQRLHSEGVTFVTKILPLFSKFAIQCCDEQRVLPRKSLTNFCWSGRAPRFLRGLLLKAISGCPVSLRSIRQFCDYMYKASFGFTESQLESAEKKYLSTDLDLENEHRSYEGMHGRNGWSSRESFLAAIRKSLHTIFPIASQVTADNVFLQNKPRYGPGSFAGSGSVTSDYGVVQEVFKKLPGHIIGTHDRGASAFSGYFRAFPSAKRERISCRANRTFTNLKRFTSEIRFVPKDSRGPRVISKEPFFRLMPQMAFSDFFSALFTLESNGRINFADQTVNQKLAQVSSIDRSFATIDLKDASDRVSLKLVGSILQHTNALRLFAMRFRATHVSLPKKGVHRLRKFANMGSGLCFPILSLVVYLTAVTAISIEHHLDIHKAKSMVYVYGDDVIVPTKYYSSVVHGLELASLKVNTDKSFTKGYFRESCGGDYYHGVDVTPVRFKMSGESFGAVSNYRNGCLPFCDDRGILQLERHARELVDAGLFDTASYIYKTLKKRFHLPSVSRESSALGIYDPFGCLSIGADDDSCATLPVPVSVRSPALCPYKLMAPFLRTGQSHGTDPYSVSLRYKVRLKTKRDIGDVLLRPYGLSLDPRQIFNLNSLRS